MPAPKSTTLMSQAHYWLPLDAEAELEPRTTELGERAAQTQTGTRWVGHEEGEDE